MHHPERGLEGNPLAELGSQTYGNLSAKAAASGAREDLRERSAGSSGLAGLFGRASSGAPERTPARRLGEGPSRHAPGLGLSVSAPPQQQGFRRRPTGPWTRSRAPSWRLAGPCHRHAHPARPPVRGRQSPPPDKRQMQGHCLAVPREAQEHLGRRLKASAPPEALDRRPPRFDIAPHPGTDTHEKPPRFSTPEKREVAQPCPGIPFPANEFEEKTPLAGRRRPALPRTTPQYHRR